MTLYRNIPSRNSMINGVARLLAIGLSNIEIDPRMTAVKKNARIENSTDSSFLDPNNNPAAIAE